LSVFDNGEARAPRAQRSNQPFGGAEALQPIHLPSSRRISGVVVRRIRSLAGPPSCWCRRRPQPGNLHQDLREHLSRHGDLGHMERDVAAMADELGVDLDQFLARLVSDHGSAVLGSASVRMKLPRLWNGPPSTRRPYAADWIAGKG
jgi:hypothetical protein